MQKLHLSQVLSQKLSPQQIQFIKLLQVPTAELESRVEEELEINPALEEGKEEDSSESEDNDYEDTFEDEAGFEDKDVNIDDYLSDDYSGYKMQGDGNGGEEEEKEMPIMMVESLTDHLNTQLGFLRLDETKETIGKQIIGSIEADGYIRRPMQAIVNDLAFTQGVYTSIEEVEEVLRAIQTFDPAGIAARDLKECLLLQLDRKSQNEPRIQDAIRIVDEYFDEFSKKHYEKIQKRLNISDEAMKDAISLITKLNPKPGASDDDSNVTQFLMPDFILTNNNGKLEIFLNSKNAPELRVSTSFHEMLETYDKSDKNNKSIKETVTFIKQKLDSAKWFIDAIKQRQETLYVTMNAIMHYQKDYFLEGDETKLKPMILKDIADLIGLDISTVSRVANSKYVETPYGTKLIKEFFSEAMKNDQGEDVSTLEIKKILQNVIEEEDKQKPLPDDQLAEILKEKGYPIARRTVAKYRDALRIPSSVQRKREKAASA